MGRAATAFDARAARNIFIPLAQAAYNVMDGIPAGLPAGFEQTSLLRSQLQPGDDLVSAGHPAVRSMLKPEPSVPHRDTTVFGLMGRNATTSTAFVAFRGSADIADWIHDFEAISAPYSPIAGFGEVHAGFLAVYELVRDSLAKSLPAACSECTSILVTGHSLGAAVATLAAPDIMRILGNGPNKIEPQVLNFASPRVGLARFVSAFNASIESCYRVVNFLDIVPHIPLAPYTHVGAEIIVNSKGLDFVSRHLLPAYAAGLDGLLANAASRDPIDLAALVAESVPKGSPTIIHTGEG